MVYHPLGTDTPAGASDMRKVDNTDQVMNLQSDFVRRSEALPRYFVY